MSQSSSVSVETRLLDDQGSIPSRGSNGNFSLHHCIQTGSGADPAPIQWVLGALSKGVKWPGCDDHSLPSSAMFKNVWSYTSTPPIHLHDVVLD